VTVYFISGLGVDKRAFQKIQLPHGFEICHIDWISPLHNETLTAYSLRLAEKIDTQKPFILIGLSFGGIVITEIAKKFKPLKSIIISSASSNKQLPWYYKLIGKLGIQKIIPTGLLKIPNPLTFWAFGTTTKEEKELLTQVLKEIDKKYLMWSINAILTWTSEDKPANLFHIHGTADKILPIKFVEPDVIIEGGKHFMILSKADEINEILNEELSKINS